MAPPPSQEHPLSPHLQGMLFASIALLLIATNAQTALAATNDTTGNWFDDPQWDNASSWRGAVNISEQPPEREPSCFETWECGRWSSCQDNNQARYCFDTAGCSRDLREETQACETPQQAAGPPEETTTETSWNTYTNYHSSTTGTNPCFEIWRCENWSACDKGIQTRTCSDGNDCNTTAQQPALTQTCESCFDLTRNQGEEDVDCGGPCEPCIEAVKENVLIQFGEPPVAAEEPPPLAAPAIKTSVKTAKGMVLIWMLIGALTLASAIYLYIRKAQAEQIRELSALLSPTQIEQVTLYVREAMANGKRHARIREELAYHGYTKDLIAAVFRRAKR